MYPNHLPLYRQEAIFARTGLALKRFALAARISFFAVQLLPLVDAMKAELLRHR